MTRPPFKIGNLREIAIRCRDYPAMQSFYRDVLGLTLLAEPIPGISFFNLAPGHLGHTQVLALFAHDVRREGETVPIPESGETSSMHHLALGIAAEEQDAAANWLISQGYKAEYEHFPWIRWRGLFTADPDGNTVELVAYVGSAMITTAELMDALPHVLAAPKTDAPIYSLCHRPDFGQRIFSDSLSMTVAGGVPNDRWLKHPWLRLPNGSPDPRIQISILPTRVMELVWRDRSQPHPGDPIVADLDCSLANMPTGTLIRAGTALLRVSDVFNDACVKWKTRYGADAKDWVVAPGHPDLRLRGVLCEIVQDGEVTMADRLQVLR